MPAKGRSHEIDLALNDITQKTRERAVSGFKILPYYNAFLFNEIIGACFLLAGEFVNE